MIKKMKRLLIIWSIIGLVSCTKVRQAPDTTVLPERTIALIELFLDNTKQWRNGNEQLSLTGWMDEKKEGYFYLNICADDTTFCKPSGDCKGVVHVKGNSILLFGDSWNDYFWSSDTTYHVLYMKRSAEDEFIFYDPAEWTICIRKDTSLCEAYSALPCDISLLDSIEKILRQ